MKLKIIGLIIVVLLMAAFNSCTGVGTSASWLQIVSLTGKDLDDKDSAIAFSDVEINGSIINDNGVVNLNALTLDPLLSEVTPYMDVLVDQIDVAFRRTDGLNVEGVDVPYRFTQPMNMLVPINSDLKIPFVLIRHVAKLEAPLVALREWTNQEKILQLVAVVTIHGIDQGGHRVAPVTGYLSIWCSNFADPEPEPEPAAAPKI